MVLDHPGPMAALGNPRCKRFAMYAEDGVIKVLQVSEAPDDPAGDTNPEASCVHSMLENINKASCKPCHRSIYGSRPSIP